MKLIKLYSTNKSLRICYFGKILMISLLFSSCMHAQNTYYVKTGGNDGEDGLSDSTAWSTLSKVNSMTFSPGDSILLHKGDIWREKLIIPSSGDENNYITFGSYGTGDRPKILGSEKALNFVNIKSNIWGATNDLLDPYNVPGVYPMEIWFLKDGETTWGNPKKTYTTNFSNLTQEYDWTWHNDTIYVYADSDPDSRYDAIECGQRDYSIYLNNKDYIEINGLDLMYGRTGINCEYPNTGRTGFISRDCHIAYLAIKNGSGFGIQACYNDMLIEYDTIHDCGRRSVSIVNYGTFDISDIIVQYCEFYNGYHTTGVDIEVGSIGTATGDLDSIIVRNNLIYDEKDRPVSEGQSILNFVQGQQYETGAKITGFYFYNNILMFPSMSALQLEDVDESYVYNNTFYGHNTQKGSDLYHVMYTQDCKNATLKNNIFYSELASSTTGSMLYETYTQTYSDIMADYNLYYRAADNYKIIIANNKSYYRTDIADIRSDLGWEINSPMPADPLFISKTYLNLQPASPAIGVGDTIPGYETDYDGNPVSSPPSIGAFQGGGLFAGIIGSAQSICYNTVPAPLTQITAPSGGTGTYNYKWQKSPNNSSWADIPGATLSGYSPPTLLASTYYRRIVTSGSDNPVNSNSVLITVSPQITFAQLYDDTIIANNTSTNFNIAISGGTSPFTINYTCNGVAQPTINDYTSGTNISTGVLTEGDYIYALTSITDAIGCTAQSLGSDITVTVTRNANLAPGSIESAQSVCYNTAPAPLTQTTAPSGGTGSYTYQWQSSSDNSTWIDIPGATFSDYSPPALLENTYFRRTVTSGSFIPVYTSPVLITIYPQVTSAQLHDDISIVENTSTNFQIDISGGTPPFTVNYTRNEIAQPTIDNYISGTEISTGVLTAGIYTITLTSVTDANGCEAQSLGTNITVTVTGLISGVPNVFTPNGDGINETWVIPSINNFPDAVIRIFDRNLRRIIQYTGLDPAWDGQDSNGTPQPAGSYLYVIELNNGTKPIKGYVSLVK